MRLAELDEIGQAGHGAVVLHDLADHGGRREAGERAEVAAGLGVAGADQHAALLRGEREDVAGGDDVVRLGMTADRDLHGARAVVRGDAGGDAGGGLDRDGERGAVRSAVVAHHLLQAELAAALFGEGQTHQAARMRDELDLAGIPARENALRDKRYLKITKQLDGMTHLDNLYICGTDQGFVGIVGAIMSGISMANMHCLKE